MTNEYITEYTEETSPNATDAILLDQGGGAYKYLKLSNLIAPAAGDLTGTTLASNVVNSSLTSVGTLTSLTSSGGISGTTGTFSGGISGFGSITALIGDEEVTNGTFDTDINGWQQFQSSTLSWNSGVIRATNSGGNRGGTTQASLVPEVGKVYDVSFDYVARSGEQTARFNFAGSGAVSIPIGIYTTKITATTTGALALYSNSTTPGDWLEFDNISIKEVSSVNAEMGNFTGEVTVGAYTLPATDGTNGQVLVTNGSGVLTWTTP